MLNGPFSMPKTFTNEPLISPLLGLSNMTQEIDTRIGGRIFGMIAVSSNKRRNGALVRIVIHARPAQTRSTGPTSRCRK